jgi:hypothetical protein
MSPAASAAVCNRHHRCVLVIGMRASFDGV